MYGIGMPNEITISLAANVDLKFPAAISISGFQINEAIRNLPELDGQLLAPLGPISLTDVPIAATTGCKITSGTNGYTCTHGKGYFKATASSADVNFGMFDDEYGRIVLNLGADLAAGNHIVLRFQVRNPFCGQPAVKPCIRANRILTNVCEPATIPRAMMSVEPIGTDNMLMPAISTDLTETDNTAQIAVPGALPGEALPLFIRAPAILVSSIAQSTFYPCTLNTIYVSVATSVPLVAAVNISITVSGLRGFRVGTQTAVPMAGPASGSIAVTDLGSNGVFAGFGTWNLETGDLVIAVVGDTMAGKRYVLSFDLQNPSKEQDAAEVFLKISTFCFGDKVLMTTNSSTGSLAQGNCTGFSSSTLSPGVPPIAFGGSPDSVSNGTSPLKVIKAVLHTHFISQGSANPCTDSVIQVILSSNVPLSRCSAQLTITGLSNTMTNSTTVLPISVTTPAVSTQVANWSQVGVLAFDSSTVIPDSPCSIFAFNFTVKNQMTPREPAAPAVEMNGILGFHIASSQLTVPSTLHSWYSQLPGISSNPASNPASAPMQSWKDPLFVLTPLFTTRMMGQVGCVLCGCG